MVKTSMVKTGPLQHLHHLDGMRGVAALWVVIYHSWSGGHIDELADAMPSWFTDTVFARGWMGVPVFFMLSGFVIPFSQRNRPDSTFQPLNFMHRRWRRLSPPYYAAIALTIVVGLAEEQVRDVMFEMPSVGTIVAHLLYLQDLLDVPRIGVFFWTLAIEMQFYIVFALMKWLAGKMPWKYSADAVLGVALVVSLAWPFGWTDAGNARGVFLANWFLFLAGQAIFEATRKPYWRIPAVGYTVLLLVASFVNSEDERVIAGAVTALLLLLFITVQNSWPERALSTRPSLFLGRISYSLYLIHPAIAGAAFWIAFKVLPNSAGGELVALTAVTVSQIVASMVWWRLLEKPSIAWSRKLRSPAAAHAA